MRLACVVFSIRHTVGEQLGLQSLAQGHFDRTHWLDGVDPDCAVNTKSSRLMKYIHLCIRWISSTF